MQLDRFAVNVVILDGVGGYREQILASSQIATSIVGPDPCPIRSKQEHYQHYSW